MCQLRMSRAAALCCLVAVIILSAALAVAQTDSATVSGRVVDPSGFSVVGAQVTLVDIDRETTATASTNGAGLYTFHGVHPGRYRMEVAAKGFRVVNVTGLTVNTQANLEQNFALSIGSVSESITVEAKAAEISTAVSTVVDRQFVANLPLNGRSFQTLISLTPGVVTVPSFANFSGAFSVNGQRSDANVFMVDGVSANIGSQITPGAQTSGSVPGLTTFGTTQSLVAVDDLQEFRVQTSTYSAEYGRQPGAQISIATRSGTNEFHGTLFEYLRNDALDANDWFADRAGKRKSPERQNDFGGTFGGPVVIPGVYQGRNRTFFFFSYEGLQLRLPKFTLTNVPTLALRQSAPAGMQPILNAFPLPNGRDLGNGLAEMTGSYSDPSSLNAVSIRVDHAISEHWSMFGRYNRAQSESSNRSTGDLSNITTSALKTQTTTLGFAALLTPRISNEFRVNYSDNFGTTTRVLDDFWGAVPPPRGVLVPSQFDSPTAQSLVAFFFPGNTVVPSLGGNIDRFLGIQRQFNLVENFSWEAGSHRFKFGADYRRLTPVSAANSYLLGSTFFSQLAVLNATANSGVISAIRPVRPVYVNFSAYGQDSWKVGRRLVLDLGLRWDVNPAPGEANGNDPPAATGIDNLSTMQLAPHGTPLWRTTYSNFAPRVGAAYQVGQRAGRETTVRGGFGIFFDTGNSQASSGLIAFPYSVFKLVPGIAFPLSPAQVAPPTLPNLSNLTPPYRGPLTMFDPNLELPYTEQWNVTVEQLLGKSQALTLSYVGAVGRRLLQQRQLSLTAINPSFTTVRLTTNKATSDYHALEGKFQRRFSRGLQALASYTWSHAIDEDSADNGVIVPVRGNAAFDVRHNFATAVTYDIPAPPQNRLLKAALAMWSIDTGIHAQTAVPVEITGSQFVNPADGSLVAARANVVPGVPLYIDDPTVPGGRRINRSAFSIPGPGQVGNLGRNVVRGLGAWQVDFAIRRQFKLTEKLNLQFRAEAFNVFNHPNFGAIQTSLVAANFGQATNMLNNQLGGISPLYQIGGPRSMQIALKLQF